MIKVSGILAMLIGLLLLGTASAQDDPLECEIFGCPDSGGDSGDSGETGGDTPVDEPSGEESSEVTCDFGDVHGRTKGAMTADQARQHGRAFGHCRAGKS